jgi:hypothetical protein
LNDFEDSNQKFKNDGFLYVQAFCWINLSIS